MGPFAIRQVVLLPFPFSDLTASKLRPALVLADSGKVPEGYADWLAQIKAQIAQARQRASLSVNAELVQL